MSSSGGSLRVPQVKICGITRPRDAEAAVELGAAWIGVNFWQGSPRHVDRFLAQEIVHAVGGRAEVVGVFVNQDLGLVAELRESLGLDRVQLHGDETPGDADRLGGSGVIKAIGVDGRFAPQALAAWEHVWALLFDVRDPVRRGGTGRSWRYETVRDLELPKPWFVAGGIRPDTVRQVVDLCRPPAVDVCSGVESAPGVKDWGAMRRFFEEVHDGATASQA